MRTCELLIFQDWELNIPQRGEYNLRAATRKARGNCTEWEKKTLRYVCIWLEGT